jgi:predicted CXXCH cytochrome family protein
MLRTGPLLRTDRALTLLLAGLVGCGPVVEPLGPEAEGAADRAPAAASGLAGTVRAADGLPVAGAWVTTVPLGHEARTGEDGGYALPLLPPGAVRLVVAAPGRATVETAEVEVVEGEIVDLDVVLGDAAPLVAPVEVAVAGPDGAPLPGIAVVLRGAAGDELARAETDATGRAALEGVTDEALRVEVSDPAGALLGRQLEAGLLTAAGGLQWSVQLSGRADEDGDHIGSLACGACHPDHLAGWQDSAHARSLPAEPGPAFAAQFAADTVVDLGRGGATARLSLVGGAPTLVLVDGSGAVQELPVHGLIGDDSDRSVPWTDDGERGWPLPVGFVAEDPTRPGWPAEGGLVVPFAVDRWLDEAGRLRAPTADESAEASCFVCHATGFTVDVAGDGDVELTASRGFGRWFEGAVGCERCHGPGAEHRSETATGEQLGNIVAPSRLDPTRASDVCGQCHASRESSATGHPWYHRDGRPFVPGEELAAETVATGRFWPEGAAASPHTQVEELADAPHGLAGIGCADCHDSHGQAGHSALLRADGPSNALCLDCHLGRDFGGDEELAENHVQHVRYDPGGQTEGGRCTGCHMPATATLVHWNARSGAGELASHTFAALPPSDTVAVFENAGAETLPVGQSPAHACGDCHAWLAEDWASRGVDFPGPAGDPTLIESHEAHQDAFLEKYP